MDTMTITKAASGFLGAWLILLLSVWVADGLYSTGGHGHEQAYVIETAEEESGAEEDGPSLADLLADADIGKGAKVFKKCSACHKVEDGANATGPHLYGVVGRGMAAVDGFGYSGTLASMDGDWSAENLDAFLTNPKGFVAGTTMGFAGLKKAADRANVIAYLDSLDD